MKVNVIYRRNLKMSTGKIAAQAIHAAIALGMTDPSLPVVVLGMRDKQYYSKIRLLKGTKIAIVKDAGYTEVEPGTETCAAWYENT